MKAMIQMILYRIWKNKLYFFISLLIIPVVLFSAIFFAFPTTSKTKIVVVGRKEPIVIEEIQAIVLDKAPPFSELVEGKYDAIVTFQKDGSYTIDTIKNQEFIETLSQVLDGKLQAFPAPSRGKVTSFVGFISLFILLFNSMLFKFYYEERGGVETRILSTRISFTTYACSHFLVVFSILFFPTAILSLGANTFLFASGISNVNLLLAIFVLSFFATSFNFFIALVANTEESGSLVASMIIMIGTLLSGALLEVKHNSVTGLLSMLFPQTHIMNFIGSLEQGETVQYLAMPVIILLSLVCMVIGIGALKRRVTQK